MNDAYIEFMERALHDGSMVVELRCAELPLDHNGRRFRYAYRVDADGWVYATSRGRGKGSTRHYVFSNAVFAQEHGRKWAMRKIAEARRSKKAGGAA